MIILGSRIARYRNELCAKLIEEESFENMARSAGVLRIDTKARRIAGVSRHV
jgi:hypothetical protein